MNPLHIFTGNPFRFSRACQPERRAALRPPSLALIFAALTMSVLPLSSSLRGEDSQLKKAKDSVFSIFSKKKPPQEIDYPGLLEIAQHGDRKSVEESSKAFLLKVKPGQVETEVMFAKKLQQLLSLPATSDYWAAYDELETVKKRELDIPKEINAAQNLGTIAQKLEQKTKVSSNSVQMLRDEQASIQSRKPVLEARASELKQRSNEELKSEKEQVISLIVSWQEGGNGKESDALVGFYLRDINNDQIISLYKNAANANAQFKAWLEKALNDAKISEMIHDGHFWSASKNLSELKLAISEKWDSKQTIELTEKALALYESQIKQGKDKFKERIEDILNWGLEEPREARQKYLDLKAENLDYPEHDLQELELGIQRLERENVQKTAKKKSGDFEREIGVANAVLESDLDSGIELFRKIIAKFGEEKRQEVTAGMKKAITIRFRRQLDETSADVRTVLDLFGLDVLKKDFQIQIGTFQIFQMVDLSTIARDRVDKARAVLKGAEAKLDQLKRFSEILLTRYTLELQFEEQTDYYNLKRTVEAALSRIDENDRKQLKQLAIEDENRALRRTISLTGIAFFGLVITARFMSLRKRFGPEAFAQLAVAVIGMFIFLTFHLQPELTESQKTMMDFLAACCAAYMGITVSGTTLIRYESKISKTTKITVIATAGAALFLIVLFYAPFSKKGTSDSSNLFVTATPTISKPAPGSTLPAASLSLRNTNGNASQTPPPNVTLVVGEK